MRCWMLTLFVVGALGSIVGCNCNCVHTHGVCDCEHDDYCSSRSPWIRFTGHVNGNGNGNGLINGNIILDGGVSGTPVPVETIPAPQQPKAGL